jgi:hypothetical protein
VAVANFRGMAFSRQWRLSIAVVAAAVIVAGAIVATRSGEATPADPGPVTLLNADQLRQPIHEHADFAVFIRGQRFDFGQEQFISDADEELSPNVHIHDPRHTVVHVHREGTTWDEFLRSVGFELTDATNLGSIETTAMKLPSGEVLRNTSDERFTFIVNGVKVDGIAGSNIHGLERVLISYGSEPEEQVWAQFGQVTNEACIPAGVCIERGNGNGEHGEPEPCTGKDAQCTG